MYIFTVWLSCYTYLSTMSVACTWISFLFGAAFSFCFLALLLPPLLDLVCSSYVSHSVHNLLSLLLTMPANCVFLMFSSFAYVSDDFELWSGWCRCQVLIFVLFPVLGSKIFWVLSDLSSPVFLFPALLLFFRTKDYIWNFDVDRFFFFFFNLCLRSSLCFSCSGHCSLQCQCWVSLTLRTVIFTSCWLLQLLCLVFLGGQRCIFCLFAFHACCCIVLKMWRTRAMLASSCIWKRMVRCIL